MASIEKREFSEGKVTYRVKVRLKGYPTQTATFSRLTDARKWGQSIESAIREGRHFKTSKAKKHTISDLIERYSKEVLPRNGNNAKNERYYLEWWKDNMGAYTLADITTSLIIEYRDKLLSEPNKQGRKRSPSTANRYTTSLGHLLNIAVNDWELMEKNPINKRIKLKEPRGRVRFLEDNERQNLLEACLESRNKYLYPVVVLALSTGARKNEILKLTWGDVDLQRGLVILLETKNGERRALPLKGLAYELVLKLSVKSVSKYLFPSVDGKTSTDIRTAWENAVTKAGIEDFRFHDLRHSAASYLAMNGASLAEIAEVLGHKTLAMVKRYAHLSEAHTASVVERMNKKVFGDG